MPYVKADCNAPLILSVWSRGVSAQRNLAGAGLLFLSGLMADSTYLHAGSDAAETVVRVRFLGRDKYEDGKKMSQRVFKHKM